MKKIILVFSILLQIKCGIGTPDDESVCDQGRILAPIIINLSENRRQAETNTFISDILPLLVIENNCAKSYKEPGP